MDGMCVDSVKTCELFPPKILSLHYYKMWRRLTMEFAKNSSAHGSAQANNTCRIEMRFSKTNGTYFWF